MPEDIANTKAARRLDSSLSEFLLDLLVARRSNGIEGPYVFPADSRSGHIEEPRFALNQIEIRKDIVILTIGARVTV